MAYSIDIYLTDGDDGFLASFNVKATNINRVTNDMAYSLDLLNRSCSIGATVAKIYVNDGDGHQVSAYKLKRRKAGHFHFVESLEYEVEERDDGEEEE